MPKKLKFIICKFFEHPRQTMKSKISGLSGLAIRAYFNELAFSKAMQIYCYFFI